MQRQWTIEVRADCEPAEKEAINTAIRRNARHLLTLVGLLPTPIKVQVVAYSEDFFDGHEDINLWEDHMGLALEQNDAKEETPSAELLEAAKEIRHGG